MKNVQLTLLAVILLTVFCVERSNAQKTVLSQFCDEGQNEDKWPCPPNAIPGGSCTLERLRNDHCQEYLDAPVLQKDKFSLASVNLTAYQYFSRYKSFPQVNVSITNINFTSMVFKFAVVGTNVTECRKFKVSHVGYLPLESSILFWDCRWFQSKYSRFPMTFEYRATDGFHAEYKKLHFKLPEIGYLNFDQNNTSDLELFIYRENHSQCVTFYWAQPPKHYEILKYRVTLNEQENSAAQHNSFILNDTSKSFCQFPKFNTFYNISVEPCFGKDDGCHWGRLAFSEPFYTIPDSSPVATSVVVLAAVVIVLGILGTLFCCTYFMKGFAYKKVKKPERCIIVYEPTSESHLHVVEQLASFISSVLDPVLYAETAIKSNEDPTDWWPRELEGGDLILIVSNPPVKNKSDLMASKYFPVFVNGFVKDTLRRLIRNSPTSKRYIRILLPYCSKNDFYDFLKAMPCYDLYDDRLKLVQQILGPHNVCLPKCISWFLYASIFQSKSWRDVKTAVENHVHNQRADAQNTMIVKMDSDDEISQVDSAAVSDKEVDAHDQVQRKMDAEGECLSGDEERASLRSSCSEQSAKFSEMRLEIDKMLGI